MFKKIICLSCLCLFGFAASAKADPIGPTNCATCDGSQYTLTYLATSNPDVFDIFLKVDTSATTLPGDYLNAVAPKVSSSFTSVTLISGPSTFTSVESGGIGNGGCTGSGSGFFCSESSGKGDPTGTGKVYNFEWQLTLASAADLMLTGDSIKARYVNVDGTKVGSLTSEDITLQPGTPPPPVPEPGSLLLVCTGLLGAAVSVRRRFSR
jgi:hypothetical protein